MPSTNQIIYLTIGLFLEKILSDTRGLSQKKLPMSSSYSFELCHHGRPGGAHYNTKFLTLGY